MGSPAQLIGTIADVMLWVSLLAAFGFLLAGLLLRLFDGEWVAVRGVVESTDAGHVVRWFDDEGGVNEARLTHAEADALGGRDMADIFYRRGWRNRMRLTPRSPAVAGFLRIALVMGLVSVVLFIGPWILLLMEG